MNNYSEFENCSICQRECNVNRNIGEKGYCNSGNEINISSICCHNGEEPPISGLNGVCNIFFGHCNLQCIYCQNHQISNNESNISKYNNLDKVVSDIIKLLDSGCKAVGFVSPSHFIPHVKEIINQLKCLGLNPIFIYNSNGYDKVETIKSLEGLIDIYLPDFKYSNNEIAKEFSETDNYFETALSAITEMYKQKGSDLKYIDDYQAKSGLIIRHLVLPGYIENSLNVIKTIANNISNKVYISLMSQYYPTFKACNHKTISRSLSEEEYNKVIDKLEELGFENGWIQELDSKDVYKPDFNNENPFIL